MVLILKWGSCRSSLPRRSGPLRAPPPRRPAAAALASAAGGAPHEVLWPGRSGRSGRSSGRARPGLRGVPLSFGCESQHREMTHARKEARAAGRAGRARRAPAGAGAAAGAGRAALDLHEGQRCVLFRPSSQLNEVARACAGASPPPAAGRSGAGAAVLRAVQRAVLFPTKGRGQAAGRSEPPPPGQAAAGCRRWVAGFGGAERTLVPPPALPSRPS